MAINVPIISSFDSRGVNKAIRDFKKLETGSEKMAFGLLNADAAARKMAGAFVKIGGAAGLVGAFATKAFVEFDDAMNQSLAIMGDVSDEMKTKMSQAARDMAKETTFSATQAAQSYFYLASAGLDAEQSVAALPRVAKFAQAGMFDMALATDLLTDAQSALGLTIKGDAIANMNNMSRVADVLVKANTLANASVEQFSSSLTNKAAAAARIVGKDVEEVVAVLAAFADQGIKGEDAGTQLSIVMRDLQTRALENHKAFKASNIEVFDQSGKMRNLGQIVQQLEKRLGGMSDAQKKAELATLGFTDKSQAALLTLVGTGDAIVNYEKQLRNAAGTTDTVAGKQMESLKSQIILLKNNFMDLAITLGERLAPIVAGMVRAMQTLSSVIAEKGLGAGFEYLTGKIVDGIGKLGLLGKTIAALVAAFALLRVATVTYTGVMGALNVITTLSNGALATLITQLGAARIAMLAAGGITALLGVAAIAYGIYAKRKSDAVDRTREFAEALKLEGEAQTDALVQLYKTDAAFKENIDTLTEFNYNLQDFEQYLETGAGGLLALEQAGGKYLDMGVRIDKVVKSGSDAITKQTIAFYNLRNEVPALKGATDDQVLAFLRLVDTMRQMRAESLKTQTALGVIEGSLGTTKTEGSDPLDKSLEDLLKELEDLKTGSSSAAGGLSELEKKAEEARRRFADFKSQAESVFSQQKSLRDATKDTAKAYGDLTTATKSVSDAQAKLNQIVKGYGSGSAEANAAQAELTQAQRDAERAGYDLEKANFAVKDAETALAEARAEGDQQAIREAEIALAEAKLSVKDAEDALTASTRAVTEAQTKLNETINGATTESNTYKSALAELRSAQDEEVAAVDRVNEAKIREFETTRKLAEAELALAKIKKTLSKAQRKQARKLLDKLGAVPSDLITTPPSQTPLLPSFDFGSLNLGALGIPFMADGGIVTRPTLAMIGERGSEAVIPLSKADTMSGDTYNITINSKIADDGLPDLLVAELRKFNRRSGAINIQVA